MFEDDVYDLDKGNVRWVIQPADNGFQVLDSESDVRLLATYSEMSAVREIVGILNEYEVTVARLQSQADNGQHRAGNNGH